jgi:hypothetical protein
MRVLRAEFEKKHKDEKISNKKIILFMQDQQQTFNYLHRTKFEDKSD